MKKNILRIYIMLLIIPHNIGGFASSNTTCDHNCETYSRSFLDIRPPFLSASPERVAMFRSEQIHACVDGHHNALQLVPLGSLSFSSQRPARYFLPVCQDICIVDEQAAVADKDILATLFNITTQQRTFRSLISLAPRQRFFGIGIEYRHEWLRKEKHNRGWWLAASTILLHVRNSIGLCERIINDGGGADRSINPNAVGSMTAALDQHLWKFGHITKRSYDDTGFADIEFKIGYEWLSHTPYHLESYIGALIPTSAKPNGYLLFQPLVGNGRHWGLIFGSRAGFDLADYPSYGIHIRMELSNHTQFLFPDSQIRALDLKNRPWSRYMPMYANEEQAEFAAQSGTTYEGTPGINILTRCVQVKPGIANTINTAGVITIKGVHLEGGYNIYVRTADSVSLKTPWQEGPALQAAEGRGTTNPVRTIQGNALIEAISVPVDEYSSSIITAQDLDLQTATHPCTLLQTLYGSIGYTLNKTTHPLFFNLGGSYMFTNASEATSALPRLMIWAKWALSF